MTEQEKIREMLGRMLRKGFGLHIPPHEIEEFPDSISELLLVFASQNYAYRRMFAEFGMDAMEAAAKKILDEHFSDDATEIWGDKGTPEITGGIDAGK